MSDKIIKPEDVQAKPPTPPVPKKKKVSLNQYIPPVFAKGYSNSGASTEKGVFKDFKDNSGSAHEDIEFNLQTLRQRSRQLFMDSPIAQSILKTYRTNTIGQGLHLQPRVNREVLGWNEEKAADWQKQVQREFEMWAEDPFNCDSTGQDDFYDLQQLAFLSYLMSGDCFVAIESRSPTTRRPYALRLHVLEADRIRTPDTAGYYPGMITTAKTEDGNIIYDGIEVDSRGQVVAYHVASIHPYEMGTDLEIKWDRIRARGGRTGLPNMAHVMVKERPEQYRGKPILAEAIEPILQMRRFTEAELTAAVVQAMFTVFVKTTTDVSDFPLEEGVIPHADQDEEEYSLGPGTINTMAPDEDVVFANPTRPSSSFEPYINANLTQVAAGVELPLEVITKQHNSSYTAARANNLEAWKAFRMQRKWFIQDFCMPIYENFLSEAIYRGRIDAPGFLDDPLKRKAYLGCEWIGPSMGMLNPKDEIEASSMLITQGFSTYAIESQKLSETDWYENVEALKAQRELLAEVPVDPLQTRTIQYEGEGGEGDEL